MEKRESHGLHFKRLWEQNNTTTLDEQLDDVNLYFVSARLLGVYQEDLQLVCFN